MAKKGGASDLKIRSLKNEIPTPISSIRYEDPYRVWGSLAKACTRVPPFCSTRMDDGGRDRKRGIWKNITVARSNEMDGTTTRLPLSRPIHWPDSGDRYVREVSMYGIDVALTRICVCVCVYACIVSKGMRTR